MSKNTFLAISLGIGVVFGVLFKKGLQPTPDVTPSPPAPVQPKPVEKITLVLFDQQG